MRRVALVTGGGVRVGGALSLGLAEAGYDVVLHYHRSAGAAREVARAIEALGRRVELVAADLSTSEGAEAVVAAAASAFGRLDLLVNSAASFEAAAIADVDAAAWDRVLALNLRGPFLIVRAATSLLHDSRGSVVNILDLSALQPWVDYPHHAVAKAGLLHLTRILARSLAPHVRVNAVAPGPVLPPEGLDEAARERERRRTPLGSIGTPQDVVRTVVFLASSPFITGEVVKVDGGRSLTG
jgi:pteridine reductase